MLNTTLCYIEKDNKYLMLHRIKKQGDINKDKWIGVGGKFEDGESPEDCLYREVKEETGLRLQSAHLRGIVTFIADGFGTEYMYLFTSKDFSGTMKDCDEGELVWVEKDRIEELNIWEGDKVFLKLLREDSPFFSLKLHYHGDDLKEQKLVVY